MTTNQACAGILPSEDHDERYLFYWLWSQYETLREDYDGTSQPNLNKGMIESLAPPLPPLEEQRAIADGFDAFARLMCCAEAEAEAARSLKGALAQHLLSDDSQLREMTPA
jgi:type I restriction enzyme S subunit